LKSYTLPYLSLHHWRFTPAQILVCGFAGLILIGALLLMLPAASKSGQSLRFIDALFTATSAVCVTGLVVVDTGTTFTTLGHLIIIGLIQAGGLGIMTIAVLISLIMGKRIHLRERLVVQEALNQFDLEGVVRLTKYVVKVTLLIEFIGGTILALRWSQELGWEKGLFYGYWHGISSFCNAGFDLFGEYRSITGYAEDWTINLVIAGLIILGGIGFTVMADIYRYRKFTKLSLHSKVVLTTTIVLIVLGAILIFLFEFNNPATMGNLSIQGKVLSAYFQSVSPRTAGYNTLPIGELYNATLFLIVILMFIGASPASTGGGIKTTSLAVLSSAVWSMTKGTEHPELYERRLAEQIIYKAFSLVVFSLLLVIVVTMGLCITEKFPFLNILFEVVSAFGTVGLTTGITPNLSVPGKVMIILTMFAGRVGPITLAFALGQRKIKALYKHPEGKVIIG
jgi:trk system potassium uptake protein